MTKLVLVILAAFLLASCCDECCNGCPEPVDFECEPDTTILIPISANGQSWISSFVSDTLNFEYHEGGFVQYTLNSIAYDTVSNDACDTVWQYLMATINYQLVLDSFADSSITIRLVRQDLRANVRSREYLQLQSSSGLNTAFFIDDSTRINRETYLNYYPYHRTFDKRYWNTYDISDRDYNNINQVLFSRANGIEILRGYPDNYNPLFRLK